jgi:hypothetical protein
MKDAVQTIAHDDVDEEEWSGAFLSREQERSNRHGCPPGVVNDLREAGTG